MTGGAVSVKQRLRTLVCCVTLEVGTLLGVPMRPEQIQDLMQTLNQPQIAQTNPDESDNGDGPEPGTPREPVPSPQHAVGEDHDGTPDPPSPSASARSRRSSKPGRVSGTDDFGHPSRATIPGMPFDSRIRTSFRTSFKARGRFQVYVDGSATPALQANDTSIRAGRVGLGSFDDTGESRDVVVTGTPAR